MSWQYTISFSLIITSFVYVVIGVLVYSAVSTSKMRRSYLLSYIGLAGWSLFYGLMTPATSELVARTYWAIGFLFNVLFFPAWISFLSHLSSSNTKTYQNCIYVLFVLKISLAIACIFSKGITLQLTKFGYQFLYASNFWFIALFICSFVSVIIMTILLMKWLKTAKFVRQKKAAFNFIILSGIFTLPVFFLDYIRPVFLDFTFTPVGPILILVVSIQLLLSMRMYRSLDITVANVADDMFTSLDLPVLILNENNSIVLANTCAKNLFLSDIIGRNIIELISVETKEHDSIMTYFDNSFENLNITINSDNRIKNCTMLLSVIKDKYGDVINKIVTISDISDLINAKLELEERHKMIFENTPIGLTTWDDNLNPIDCNQETLKLFNLKTKQEFIEKYKSFLPLHQPNGNNSYDFIMDELKKAFKDGINWVEAMLIAPDGGDLPLDLNMVRVPKNDTDYEIMIFFRDLSVQKALLEEKKRIEMAEQCDLVKNDYIGKLNSVNDITNMLLLSDYSTFDNDLHKAMGILGKVVDADRMFIWKNYMQDDLLHCKQIYEWVSDVEATIDDELSAGTSYKDSIPEWEALFLNNKIVNDFVCNLSQNERSILEPQGIVSILIVPVYLNDYFWGFVGFDDCRNKRIFSINEENLLRTVSMIIINAINRNDMAKEMHRNNIQLENALKKAEEATLAKTKFLAAMSHEIRTPMNAIMGISQMQLQKGNLSDDVNKAIDKIYASGKSLMGIINDILDLSKIETGKMEIIPIEYDLPSLVNDTVQLNIVRVGSKPIEFILDIDESLPMRLIGDELRIKQILNNILSNAIKYTERGYVRLSITHSCPISQGGVGTDVFLHFTIKDSGQGMKPEDCKRLFSEYSRFNIGTNRVTEGVGLGLNITKSLVELMDGSIAVKSKYNVGSTFSVTVKQKLVICEPIGADLCQQLSAFTFSGKKQYDNMQIVYQPMPYGRVLVVDDVDTNLYVAEGLMAPYQLQIDTALSGFVTIEKIKFGAEYDVIFMDHMMPQMDGIETTKILREIGYNKPIVALTANAIIGNESLFEKNGFDGFVSKPVDIRHLNTILNKFVRDCHPEEAKNFHDSVLPDVDSVEKKKILHPKIVTLAIQDIEKSIASMKDTLETGDLKLFTVNAHAMKTVLTNIGENGKADLALELEKAGRFGDMKYISKNAHNFIESLEKLVVFLTPNEKFHEKKEESNQDNEYLNEELNIILNACYEYKDTEAYEALDRLKSKNWNNNITESLEDIKETLYLYSNFEEAAEKVKKLL